MGWAGFFGLTVVLALPALVLLRFLPEGIAAPKVEEEPASEAVPATPAPAVAR
jgi:PAT family beta-lactamase induction signal transducer AmpG